ncbi:MAG TPA: hypothetical protein VFD90_00870 [Gaiellales bacterium]|jgi:hypothetical protein|nr:hypothetical protein [Gaiellales bacterium]
MRRPAPATIIATAALALAVVPVGQAAGGWVKRALYARNAGSVDGLSASRVPRKGNLIALPKTGKLPASILPASIGGPRGPAGPAGTSGDGGSAIVASGGAAVTLAAAQTALVTLNLKPGSYAIVGKASLHATLDTSTPGVTCQLRAGADGDQVDADLSSSSDDPVALITTHTFAAAGVATLTCAADDGGVIASDARIVALRVAALTSG